MFVTFLLLTILHRVRNTSNLLFFVLRMKYIRLKLDSLLSLNQSLLNRLSWDMKSTLISSSLSSGSTKDTCNEKQNKRFQSGIFKVLMHMNEAISETILFWSKALKFLYTSCLLDLFIFRSNHLLSILITQEISILKVYTNSLL